MGDCALLQILSVFVSDSMSATKGKICIHHGNLETWTDRGQKIHAFSAEYVWFPPLH
jgi:hypothetical protein